MTSGHPGIYTTLTDVTYDCGLPRHKAEALAYRAHGLEPPVSRPAVS